MGHEPGPTPPPQTSPGPTVYKRYRLQVINTSITDGDVRQQAWQLLQELRKVIDPATRADHQLLSLDLTLVTAEGQHGAIEAKAAALGARVPSRMATSRTSRMRRLGMVFTQAGRR